MISVCIATYNGERFIKRQLESILTQLGERDEVVVSDDGSTDRTLQIISDIADRRIRTVVNKGPEHSPTANFQNAMKEAKGDYVFLSDQDDIWLPHKVETMMNILKNGDCHCVISDALMTDEHERVTNDSLYEVMHVGHGRLYNLLAYNGYTGCCMAFSRKVLDKALPFPADIPMHDIWIGNVAAFFFNLKFISEPLILFRRHSDVASCNGKGSRFSLREKLLFRWKTLKNLIKLSIRNN